MPAYRISPSQLSGHIEIPSSKSHSMRAILLAAMADGKSRIDGVLASPDIEAMIVACRQLGAKVDRRENSLHIRGVAGKPQTPTSVIDAGNSGQVLRFVAAFAALAEGVTEVTGDVSIQTLRPVVPLLEGLEGLGAKVHCVQEKGCAPFTVQGPISAGKTRLVGQDSQPVSALLMMAPFLEGRTEICVDQPGEIPWIELTLAWLERVGITIDKSDDYRNYRVRGPVIYPGFNYRVAGDFSSLAFPIAAALVTGSEISVGNVDMSDVQGDKKVIDIFEKMGAEFTINSEAHSLKVHPGASLRGGSIDLNEVIDAITILAVVACFAEEEMLLYNAAIARHKECDRIASIVRELRKMGAQIEERPDGLVVRKSPLHAATLDTYHDHRMVMSLSVAAMAAEGISTVRGVDCVAKSYPVFAEQMQALGAQLIRIEESV